MSKATKNNIIFSGKTFVKKIEKYSSISQVREIPEVPNKVELELPKPLSRDKRGYI